MTEKEIRTNWDAALESVTDGCEPSAKVHWGFTKDDLLELCRLHESGKHREKIVDLLEDCNFHTYNGFLIDKNYEDFRHEVEAEFGEIPFS